MQKLEEEEVAEPRPAPILKEGTATIVILKDLTIFNPGGSINQIIRVSEMAKISIGAPSTRWKGNLMGFI